MAIDTGKILNISLTEYEKFIGKNITQADYDLIGIHHQLSIGQEGNPKKLFSQNVPDNAEVVVNYTPVGSTEMYIFQTGTALIPKNK